MPKPVLMVFAAVMVAVTAHAALQAGDVAPDFSTQASLDGKAFEFSLQQARENGSVVVYFYPSAYTNGCNIQAHEFAVNMDKFTAAGASVIGVSLDSIERLNEFSADPDYCAGKLAVASDPDGSIARSYGLNVRDPRVGKLDTRGVPILHGYAERVTFIVMPDGAIAETIAGVSPFDNVQKSLEAVSRHRATQSQ